MTSPQHEVAAVPRQPGRAAAPAEPGRPDQLPLDGMPARLYPCTPTRLATWQDCPRRYRWSYLDRPAPAKGAPWAHNSLGASVHTALAAWWREPLAHRTPGRAGTLLAAGWLHEGYPDEETSATWRQRARGMVERYTASLDPHREPVGVERTVGARTATLAFSGRIDRLDERGGELVVVDYKTGRRPSTGDDARGSSALALYAVAASRVLRRACHRVELHHLPSGTVAAHEHAPEALERHVRRAEAVAAEAAAADAAYAGGDRGDAAFPPQPGPLCGWCDFSRHCPEGRAAAAPKRAWDGLDATWEDEHR